MNFVITTLDILEGFLITFNECQVVPIFLMMGPIFLMPTVHAQQYSSFDQMTHVLILKHYPLTMVSFPNAVHAGTKRGFARFCIVQHN